MLGQCHRSSLDFPPHSQNKVAAAPSITSSHDDTPGSGKERGVIRASYREENLPRNLPTDHTLQLIGSAPTTLNTFR